jgi:outer membrane biosynthesis protein TonB
MADSEPNSIPPSRIPGTSNNSTPYVVVIVALLLTMGGLIWWKTNKKKQAPETKTPATASTPSGNQTPVLAVTDSVPPPPELEDAGTEEDAGKPSTKPKGSLAGGGCSGTCTGTPAGGFQSELRSKAGRARGCYERALRSNPDLAGRLSVVGVVDPRGVICSVSVANNSLGSPMVSQCILGMFRGQTMSPPSGGCVNFSIPFNFQPKK